jgi:uncharacterized protein (TIGR00255 family)
MLYSMTGYGKSNLKLGDKNYIIEIKSLNSKSLDLNFKAIAELRGKEIDIRKLIASQLIRGKVDLYFQEEKSNGTSTTLNFGLIEQYYQQLQQFSKDKNIPVGDVIPAILRFQDIAKGELAELDAVGFDALKNAVEEALDNIIQFRKDEGKQLEKDIVERIKIIQQLKESLSPYEISRIEKLKEKLKNDVAAFVQEESIDKNRFEEELIYYLEKMDINEEKVRLETHCNYFLETIKEEAMESGKKLGFIAQEIGREINTIGSKANDANMQKIVVQMKDELEKIKEQVLNIL